KDKPIEHPEAEAHSRSESPPRSHSGSDHPKSPARHKSSRHHKPSHHKSSHHHKSSRHRKSRRHKRSRRLGSTSSNSPSSSGSSSSSSHSSSPPAHSHSVPRSRTVPDDWFDKLQDERIESSWVAEPKHHGQRQKRVDTNGKRIVSHTRIEELRTRDKKDAYVKEHGHWFGCRFKFDFNPSSKDKSLLSKSHRLIFPRPWPQAGRDKNNLQYAMASRTTVISTMIFAMMFSTPVLPMAYPTAMLGKYPFLSHCCDEDGDSWPVKMMAQTFLGGQKSQQTRRASKENSTHKRHHHRPDHNAEEQPGSEGSPEPAPPNNNNDPPRPALSGKAAADHRKAAKRIKDAEEAAKAVTKDQAASKATKSRSLKSARAKKPPATNDDDDNAGHPPAFHRDPLQESEAGPSKDAGQLKEGPKEAKNRGKKKQ
ncbi:hypothetical protein FRC06_004531, partial [Ceratobasidium sp. 370]